VGEGWKGPKWRTVLERYEWGCDRVGEGLCSNREHDIRQKDERQKGKKAEKTRGRKDIRQK